MTLALLFSATVAVSLLATGAAGLTVSCCVAAVRPEAEAVRVGVPARVSLYLKLAVLLPAAIDTELMGPPLLSWKTPLALVEARLTVRAVLVRLPYWSCSWTVMVPEVAPAVRGWGVVVKTSLLAAAGLTVSCGLAAVRPEAEVVGVGVPATVSR